MAVAETSRTYTISLPAETARRAEELAARDGRSLNELVVQALETYDGRSVRDWLAAVGEYSRSRNPGYTEVDIPRLIREVREEAAEPSSK
ncbi:MAG: hypothetical protein V4555_10325 [Acidobacteriota bacterium]